MPLPPFHGRCRRQYPGHLTLSTCHFEFRNSRPNGEHIFAPLLSSHIANVLSFVVVVAPCCLECASHSLDHASEHLVFPTSPSTYLCFTWCFMSHRSLKRFRGLSKSVSVHGFRGGSRYTRVLRAGRQAERLHEIEERRIAEVQGVSSLV